jgi:uncharacterized protein (TIGR04255 family)
MSDKKPKYSRPPIVEAVFEFRFAELLSARDLDRIRDRLKSRYPAIQERRNIGVQVQENGKVETTSNVDGYQMAAADARSLVLYQTNAFGTVRPAPYENWEHLMGEAKENYETFEKVLGRKTFTRISSRFINRIDIPNAAIADRNFAAWLNVGVRLPEPFTGDEKNFTFACNFPHKATGLGVVLQGGSVEPALLDCTSILLDIDVYQESDIGQHKDFLWETADRLRLAKNSVFEATITDKLRELIS